MRDEPLLDRELDKIRVGFQVKLVHNAALLMAREAEDAVRHLNGVWKRSKPRAASRRAWLLRPLDGWVRTQL